MKKFLIGSLVLFVAISIALMLRTSNNKQKNDDEFFADALGMGITQKTIELVDINQLMPLKDGEGVEFTWIDPMLGSKVAGRYQGDLNEAGMPDGQGLWHGQYISGVDCFISANWDNGLPNGPGGYFEKDESGDFQWFVQGLYDAGKFVTGKFSIKHKSNWQAYISEGFFDQSGKSEEPFVLASQVIFGTDIKARFYFTDKSAQSAALVFWNLYQVVEAEEDYISGLEALCSESRGSLCFHIFEDLNDYYGAIVNDPVKGILHYRFSPSKQKWFLYEHVGGQGKALDETPSFWINPDLFFE